MRARPPAQALKRTPARAGTQTQSRARSTNKQQLAASSSTNKQQGNKRMQQQPQRSPQKSASPTKEEQEKAATRIGSMYRGKQARAQHVSMRVARPTASSAARTLPAGPTAEDAEMAAAATRISSMYRGKQARATRSGAHRSRPSRAHGGFGGGGGGGGTLADLPTLKAHHLIDRAEKVLADMQMAERGERDAYVRAMGGACALVFLTQLRSSAPLAASAAAGFVIRSLEVTISPRSPPRGKGVEPRDHHRRLLASTCQRVVWHIHVSTHAHMHKCLKS